MKKFFIFLLVVFFFINLFYYPLKFKNTHKIEYIMEFSYDRGIIKNKDYNLKTPFYYYTFSKFSIFQDNFKKIVTYDLNGDKNFYEGKSFYAIKEKDLITFYNKTNSNSFEIKTNKNIFTDKNSNTIVLASKNGFEISVYKYNEINSKIKKVLSEVFNDIWNKISFNEFCISISFLNGSFYYFNFIDNKEYFNQFKDSKYSVGYDIAVSPNGDYFALIEGFEPQYFHIFSKEGDQKFKIKKISENRNLFVFSPLKNYFLFKNGDKIVVINKKNNNKLKKNYKKNTKSEEINNNMIDNKKTNNDDNNINNNSKMNENNDINIINYKFYVENKIPLKGDLVTYSANKYNIVFSTVFENHYVITVYNIESKNYYQFSFAYPVYKIERLDDEGYFIFYNNERFWVIKIM